MSLHYIVSQDGSHWQASFAGTVLGPFLTQEEAIDAAVKDAASRERSEQIEVLLQEANRKTVTVWKSGDGH